MKLLRLLTLRSLRTRPLRTFLSAFGIILGVASMLAIGVTNRAALDSITNLFQGTSGKSQLTVTSNDVFESEIPEGILDRIENVGGITGAIPSLRVQTMLADDEAGSDLSLNFFGANLSGISLYGIDPRIDRLAREYVIVSGVFLRGSLDANEIVLVEDYAAEKEIEVGDKIRLVTPNGARKFTVVGLMSKDGPGQINNGAFGIIPLQVAQTAFNRNGELDQIDVVVDDRYSSADSLEAFKGTLQSRLGDDYSVVYPASQGTRMSAMLGSYQIGLNLMSGMALFVGVFLIYNTFSMSVIERTREIGMLRTVGMTRRQVSLQVLAEAIVLGVVGAGAGLLLGFLMSLGLSRLMTLMLNLDLNISSVPPSSVISSALIGIVATLVAAAIPAWQAGKISPLEALRIRGTSRDAWLTQKGWKAGLVLLVISALVLIIDPFPYDVQYSLGGMTVFGLFLGATLLIPASVGIWEGIARPFFQRIYGSAGRIGSSNVQRAKLRTTLTVAALLIGVAMILVVRAMTESFKFDLVEWINAYIGGDIYVSSNVNMRSDLVNRLEGIEGVDTAVPIRYFGVKWLQGTNREETITFMAVDPQAYSQITSFVFNDSNTDKEAAVQKLAAGESVFISSVIADKYDLKEGDSITLKTSYGYLQFKIVAVVVDFYNQGLVITGSWMDMQHYFKIRDASTFLLKVGEGYSIDDVKGRIEDQLGKRYHLTIISNKSIKENVANLMGQAFSMFDLLAIISMMVASLGVINTLTMNVIERTQEIGMLRSIGMTRGQVRLMILSEAGLIGVIGTALGILFGILLSRIFFASMIAMSGYSLNYRLSTVGVIISCVMAIVISQLAALLPAKKAANTAILNAIHYE